MGFREFMRMKDYSRGFNGIKRVRKEMCNSRERNTGDFRELRENPGKPLWTLMDPHWTQIYLAGSHQTPPDSFKSSRDSVRFNENLLSYV